MSPLISIIIPVYNAEKYLRLCVGSVFIQHYSDIEIILIDDGSYDTSSLICDFYLDNVSVTVFHTRNQGVSCARNIGLCHALGEYITFLDADDSLINGALTVMYGLLTENNCEIAICTKRTYNTDGTFFKNEYPKEFEIWSGRDGLRASLCDHPATYSVWGKLFSRHTVEHVRFEENKHIHEDSFFVFECMLNNPKTVVSSIDVIRYNVSENSASRGVFSEKYLDILYFAEKKKEIIIDEVPEYTYLSENVVLKAHMALLKKLTLCNDKKYRVLEKMSLNYVKNHKNAFVLTNKSDYRLLQYINLHLYYVRKLIILLFEVFNT